MWISSFPTPFIEEIVLSTLTTLGSLVKYYLTICARVSQLSTLIHWSICFYASTILFWLLQFYSLNSGTMMPPTLFCLLRIALVIWGFCGSLQILEFLWKKFHWNFDRDCIKYIADLNSIDMLTILNLLVHIHKVFPSVFFSFFYKGLIVSTLSCNLFFSYYISG